MSDEIELTINERVHFALRAMIKDEIEAAQEELKDTISEAVQHEITALVDDISRNRAFKRALDGMIEDAIENADLTTSVEKALEDIDLSEKIDVSDDVRDAVKDLLDNASISLSLN